MITCASPAMFTCPTGWETLHHSIHRPALLDKRALNTQAEKYAIYRRKCYID